MHDLTCIDCPETIPSKMKHYYRLTNKSIVKRSWKVITVSEFSKKRICEEYKLAEGKVQVIYDGLTDIFMAEPHNNLELKSKYGLPDKYILSLSTIEPRKNLQLLIRAYKELLENGIELPDLVLAGREGWKLDDAVSGISDEAKKHIHFTGFIDDDDLAQIYREADLFIFPSKYEGFGLPVIEAMSQGTIVVCSNAASLPEVAGDAGIFFKSDDLSSLKTTLMSAINMEEHEKQARIEKGKSISKSFSWVNEAEKLHKILTEG